MAIKPWTSNYTGDNPTQDADPVTGAMPNLDDESAQGQHDGDEAVSSHVEAPRDKLQAVCKMAGDSVNAPAGSLADILDRDHAAGDARQVRLGERSSAPTTAAGKAFLYYLDDGKAYVKRGDGSSSELGVDTGGQTDTVAGSSGISNTGDNVDAVITPTYGSSANTICQGNDSRLSDPRTPTGSASGDLGGTYPGPSVEAITTTTGPTSLTVGAVADGQFLKRVGSTVVGASVSGGGGGFDRAQYFTAAASPTETFTISTAAATNANQPSGYSVRVYVNGLKHKWSASAPGAREFDIVSATQIRVGGLNISDDVEIEYGV